MKLWYLLAFTLALSIEVQAADITVNSIEAWADPSIHLQNKVLANSEFRFGMSFIEAKQYRLFPYNESYTPNKAIKRQLSLAVGLPNKTEFGFTLKNNQSSNSADDSELYPQADHASKPLGGAIWARWHLLSSDFFTSAITLQYEPGLSTKESFSQASQDRSSLALEVGMRPIDWLRTTVYGSYSCRKNEEYHEIFLKNEALLGVSTAIGSEYIGFFADTLQRQLDIGTKGTSENMVSKARQTTAGFYLRWHELTFSAYAYIPDTHRYIGVPERGFGSSLSMKFGGAPNTARPASALVPNGNIQADKNSKLPLPSNFIESNEADEFQIYEALHKKELARGRFETPIEKAERELRAQIELDKAQEAKQSAVDREEQIALERRNNLQINKNTKRAKEFKKESELEIKRYSLPDHEDLNWNGLQH